jgi:hypothetical protein
MFDQILRRKRKIDQNERIEGWLQVFGWKDKQFLLHLRYKNVDIKFSAHDAFLE